MESAAAAADSETPKTLPWGAPGTPEHLVCAATQVIACLGRSASDADATRAIALLCTLIKCVCVYYVDASCAPGPGVHCQLVL